MRVLGFEDFCALFVIYNSKLEHKYRFEKVVKRMQFLKNWDCHMTIDRDEQLKKNKGRTQKNHLLSGISGQGAASSKKPNGDITGKLDALI